MNVGEAELVFCPYNYLIDPIIRKAMDVDVSNAVLIFDEAHNIEDNARDAASADIEYSMLVETHSACVKMSQLGPRPDIFDPLANRVLQVNFQNKKTCKVSNPLFLIRKHSMSALPHAFCAIFHLTCKVSKQWI